MEEKKVTELLESLYKRAGTKERDRFFSEMDKKFEKRTKELIPGTQQINEIQFGYVDGFDGGDVLITTIHPHGDCGIGTKKFRYPREKAEKHGRIELQLPVAIVNYRAETDSAPKVELIPWDAGTFEYVPLISGYSV